MTLLRKEAYERPELLAQLGVYTNSAHLIQAANA
jgi:hypothetical protein